MQVFVRKSILVLSDILLINLSFFLALELRFDFHVPSQLDFVLWQSVLIVSTIYLVFFYFFGLYNSLWRYMSIDELIKLFGASSLSICLIYILNAIFHFSFPRSALFISWLLTMFLTGGLRLGYRVLRRIIHRFKQTNEQVRRIMIIGAGDAGSMIIKEFKNNSSTSLQPTVILDDAKWKENSMIHGVPVKYGIHNIEKYVTEYNIEEILIAIPSLSRVRLAEIVKIAQSTHCKVKTLPSMSDIVENQVSLKNIRDVSIEDLLGRDEIKLDLKEVSQYLENQVIVVTGGGGSIGSELCRQISKFKPKQLIIIDIYENNVFDIQQELLHKFPKLNLVAVIASVRDKNRILEIFTQYKPHVIFHAAAHKHVPLMEFNPKEAIKNNVVGTLNVAQCAHLAHVKRFVLISTDKAVNPTNIMGATKRVAELIIQAMNQISETEFVAVRFGNVLGSNGSVIPTFKKQIEWGGPVTVTHPDITRFFMTIPEAVRLVLQAGALASGGEIFVLDMGAPVKIIDLAKQLIILSGLEPDVDIAIEYTGLRPGEKLYEELLLSEEGTLSTRQEGIFVAQPSTIDFEELMMHITGLVDSEDLSTLAKEIKKLVPTFKHPEALS